MSEVMDREIEQAVRRFINNDPRIDPSEIEFKVQDGILYLAGVVDSAAEKHAIREDIQAVAQVEDIIDDLRLKNYVERTDDELKEAVKHALMRDISTNAQTVEIEARQGTVALKGRVGSYAQKNAVEDVAWWTPGVTDVTSQLEVESEDELSDETYE